MSQFVLNIINNKNQLKDKIPEGIIEYIISFICDRRGYNIYLYNERKKIIGLE